MIIISNIYINDLFEWFLYSIVSSGGDGCGAIVCENYKETCDKFIEWYKNTRGRNLLDYFELSGKDDTIIIHDSNESYIFSKEYIDLDNEYTFIVKENCRDFKHEFYILPSTSIKNIV